MPKEYFIYGFCHWAPNQPPYRISQCSWGMDEYDALNKLMEKEVKTRNINSVYQRISCRIRHAGRTNQKPFFENKDTSYVRGRISEFWVRFTMAETIDELTYYGEQFKRYVEKYPFTENSIKKMRVKYKQQKQQIENGMIKPVQFRLTNDMPSGLNVQQKIDYYANKATEFLQARGYRIKKNEGNQFQITTSKWHEYYLEKDETWTVTPVELILFWQDQEPRLDEKNALKGVINNDHLVLEYLGERKEKDIKEHLSSLDTAGITPFALKDKFGIARIYVVREEAIDARNVLSKMAHRLYYDYSDPFELLDDRDPLGEEYWHNLENEFEK